MQQEDQMHELAMAVFTAAAERGWQRFSYVDVMRNSSVCSDELRKRCPSKQKFLEAFSENLTKKCLESELPSDADSVPDKLFDLFMCRFELLQPYRPYLRKIMPEVLRDFEDFPGYYRHLLSAVTRMADAAGISAAMNYKEADDE